MAKSDKPIVYEFDELMRHFDLYCNQNSTKEFLEFVINQEKCRGKWEESDKECIRLQLEITNCQQEIGRQERKIQEVRRHLESKMEIVTKLEVENERLDLKNTSAKSLINSYLKDGRLNDDARDRLQNVLAILETGEFRKNMQLKSPGLALDTISEANSTDLSLTQSEDDLDVSRVRTRRQRSKRTSFEPAAQVTKKKARKSGNGNMTEENCPDKLIAKTVVSFPKDGSIQAVSSLETVPPQMSNPTSDAQIILRPSAPPLPTSESESDGACWTNMKSPVPGVSAAVIYNNEAAQIISQSQSPRFGRTLSSGGAMAMRPHAFCQKTVIKPETCDPCGKRIKFSKLALKCRDCRATCHPECKDKVPLPCVVAGTPVSKTQMGTIVDYAPTTHPMVPALIQHCVNEIELRGFDNVGLYRVPGPEKEVKELKERFLKGKGIPNLAKYDINAVCGCVKDFLRSLQEPLIGRWFWRDFALASEISDRTQRQNEIDRIIHDLPPPNQDTLAFVILHLQRVGEVTAVKMPIGNLAKVFGPTIVGYSGPDIDASTMLKETKRQQAVLETLLGMPSDFWKKFVFRPDDRIYTNNQAMSGTYTRSKSRSITSGVFTPQSSTSRNVNRCRDSARKIFFNDDSPKDTPRTRAKRIFFD